LSGPNFGEHFIQLVPIRSEAEDVTAGEVGAALKGIIFDGNHTGGRVIGIAIALEVVNQSCAGIEMEGGIAGTVEFDRATKVESVAPSALVGG
jgi:hypothetical protein